MEDIETQKLDEKIKSLETQMLEFEKYMEECASKNTKSRGWHIVQNNYTQEEWDKADVSIESNKWIEHKKCVYIIQGAEVGELCGTPHFHLYLLFKNQIVFNTIKELYPRAKIFNAKGDAQQNRKYITKSGGKTIEWGTCPPGRGKRTDLDKLNKLVIKGEDCIYDLVVSEVENYQQLKYVEGLFKYRRTTKVIPKTVWWFYGESGSGKSEAAIQYCITEGLSWCLSGKNLNWWQGYNGQDVIIIDDFRESFGDFSHFIRVIDKYPFHVEIKGGSVVLTNKIFIITSCYHPANVYTNLKEDIYQLWRRIHGVFKFKRNEYCISEVWAPTHTQRLRGNTEPSTLSDILIADAYD